MQDKIASLMAQFNAGSRQQATLVSSDDVEATIDAVTRLNPQGGKSEVFRVLHIVFGYNKPSIVKYVNPNRPQQVYNNLDDVKVEKHRERVMRVYGFLTEEDTPTPPKKKTRTRKS